ncbi:MAG: EAL domain-containing protein [Alphaproteobacteria bacterium]
MRHVVEDRNSIDDSESAALQGLSAAGDVVYDWNLLDDTIRWIGPVEGLFDLADAGEIASGDTYHGRINPEDLPQRLTVLANHFACERPYDCEYRVRGQNGHFRWVHDRGQAHFSPAGRAIRLTGVLREMTSRKVDEQILSYAANFDELTGHYNRTRLREALEHAIAYAMRYGAPGAYLAVGIDQVALMTDSFDRRTTDDIIIEIGHRLDRCLRVSDVIGRAGSDQFGVVLTQCEPDEISRVTEKILAVVREFTVPTATGAIPVTVSIGAVSFPASAPTAHEAMGRAESALRDATRAGHDCAVVYQPSEGQQRDHHVFMDIARDVQAALKEGRLVLAYQPVVHAGTSDVAYYECLVRMLTEDGSVVPAAAFIPVVEKMGLIRAVDQQVLELGIAELDAVPDLVLAINISGATATDRIWMRSVVVRLRDRPDLASRLIIEITETVALHDIDETARIVAVLRDLGCRVALDDFGAGYTSFRHLKALDVDIIKIDGSFVQDVANSSDNQLFIGTILRLARSFNLMTVAECVETEADARALEAQGILYLQGYHFGRPALTHGRSASLSLTGRHAAAS